MMMLPSTALVENMQVWTATKASKAMVADLKSRDFLVKLFRTYHSVGTHDRCGTTVEPMIKPQWFVKMDEMAKLLSKL